MALSIYFLHVVRPRPWSSWCLKGLCPLLLHLCPFNLRPLFPDEEILWVSPNSAACRGGVQSGGWRMESTRYGRQGGGTPGLWRGSQKTSAHVVVTANICSWGHRGHLITAPANIVATTNPGMKLDRVRKWKLPAGNLCKNQQNRIALLPSFCCEKNLQWRDRLRKDFPRHEVMNQLQTQTETKGDSLSFKPIVCFLCWTQLPNSREYKKAKRQLKNVKR